MFFSRPAGHKFVDRGDPAVADFDLTDFPDEDIWYDLDLSSIVPVGTKSVIIAVSSINSIAGGIIYFRTKGKTNVIQGNASQTVVANNYMRDNILIACDNNRVIQGFRSNLTFIEIDITITAWFI